MDRAGQEKDGAVFTVRVLGRLRAWRDEAEIPLGPPARRAVFGLLTLASGEPVSRHSLIDALWGDHPPASATNVLQTHVKHLRRALEPHRPARTASVVLPSAGDGYRLHLAGGQVDVILFHELAEASARAEAGDDLPRAAELSATALALWRGPAFADVPVLSALPAVERLTVERRRVQSLHADVMIRLGRADEVLAAVIDDAGNHPFDESAQALLVRSYVAVGQRARAVESYEQARQRIADELGVVPGTVLRAAYEQLLDSGNHADQTGARPPATVPRQIPADVPGFTGRRDEMCLLDEGEAVVLLCGTAGVGKTALAVHWAHHVRDRFPDGQLYVNLRGYDPAQPMAAADALAGFLSALGVAGPDIPLEVDERAARYRTAFAARRMLIVLDNAADEEQVRPLLPGTGTVLVTSRHSLAGLVARDGARRLDLDLLPPADAYSLLRRLIGARAEAEPSAVVTLADRCDRLPLALRVAAELAISRPDIRLTDLAEELAEQQDRLNLLDAGGDPRVAITAVFSWSIRHLPPSAAHTFRLLGLHPRADVDAYAVAALADTSIATARRVLDALTRAHLIHRTTTGRYGMHDLLRAYAINLAAAQDSAAEQRAASGRLFDYYLATAAAALDSLRPAEKHRRPRIALPATPFPDLGEPDVARRWLDSERPTLVAITAHTATHGWHHHTVQLAATLQQHLDRAAHYTDALTVHGHARDAAEQTGNRTHHGKALYGLGAAYMRLGRHTTATEYLHRALDTFRQTGDRLDEVLVLLPLGIIHGQTGRQETAAEHFTQALDISRQLADRTTQANALNNLGIINAQRGRHETAVNQLEQALDLHRQVGDREGEASVLDALGGVQTSLGRHAQAAVSHEQSLSLFREIGNRTGEAWALNGAGELHLATGHPTEAVTHHVAALAVATEVGDPEQQARAHTGLGHAHHALADPSRARQHYELALTLYTDLESSLSNEVRAHIAAISNAQP